MGTYNALSQEKRVIRCRQKVLELMAQVNTVSGKGNGKTLAAIASDDAERDARRHARYAGNGQGIEGRCPDIARW